MNDFVINALNRTERFIKANNLKTKIASLVLLFYQFCFLKELSEEEKDKIAIICSYYEVNSNTPYVVIMSNKKGTSIYTLKRIRLKDDIYKDLESSIDSDGEITLDDELVKHFTELYEKYSKGDKYEQLFCQRY